MSCDSRADLRASHSIRLALAVFVACALGASSAARAHTQFHTLSLSDSGAVASVGGTITYELAVTSTDAAAQIVVVARSAGESTTGSATGNWLRWTGSPSSWSGTNWSCSPTLNPGTPVCFYLSGFLPVGQTTPKLFLVFDVVLPAPIDCWTVAGIPGPCAYLGAAHSYSDNHFGNAGVSGAFASAATPIVTPGVTHWMNPAGGSWSDPGNWTNGVPSAGVSARFTIPETYTVQADVGFGDAQARAISIEAGRVRFFISNSDVFCQFPRCHDEPNLLVTERIDVAAGAELTAFVGGVFTPELYLPEGATVHAQGGGLVVGGTNELWIPNTIQLLPGAIVQFCDVTQLDALDVINHGHLPVGCSPGTLHVTGDFTQTPTGTLEIEIGNPGPSDQLIVGGTASLAGVLELRALTSPESLEHQTFQYLQAGGVTGGFSEVRNLTGVNLTLDAATGTVTTGAAHVPLADAGDDQAVDEFDLVVLDGSGSSDPDGDALTYHWTQVAGPYMVSLDLTDPVHPTFSAPNVPRGGATLSFELTVNDDGLTSEPDHVNVTVKDVNHSPVADADVDQTVAEASPVTLDGSGSFDPDGDSLTFAWHQTAGTAVTLAGGDGVDPTFDTPLVGPAGETLTFELTVGDGLASASDQVNVRVENVNHAPTADAGDDQTRDEGTLLVLDGTGSQDPDGDALTYAWSQVSGASVVLTGPDSQSPSCTAPSVGPGGEDLVFELTVVDTLGLPSDARDAVTIHVQNLNDPPLCGAAQPTLTTLWPPDHKLVSVGITGVVDPNDDQVTITVTSVTQDEALNGLGDGDTSPDAVVQGDEVLLRSERSGSGNGRVYRVSFAATDSAAGSCAGSITVCVPHSRKGSCTDSGQAYDSTAP